MWGMNWGCRLTILQFFVSEHMEFFTLVNYLFVQYVYVCLHMWVRVHGWITVSTLWRAGRTDNTLTKASWVSLLLSLKRLKLVLGCWYHKNIWAWVMGEGNIFTNVWENGRSLNWRRQSLGAQEIQKWSGKLYTRNGLLAWQFWYIIF